MTKKAEKAKQRRGFAAMSKDKARAIQSAGGRAAHRAGAHEFTSEEAKAAGRLGGLAAAKSGKKHSFNSATGKKAAAKRDRKRKAK